MTRYSRRPFPPYRHRPGKTPHPERDPRGHLARGAQPPARRLTREGWPENDDYLFGFDLFNAGYFWEAHVYWEKLWALEETDGILRTFLQGLVQLAAASLKRSEGEAAGAGKLIEKSRAAFAFVRETSGGIFLGVELDVVLPRLERGEIPETLALELG